MGQFLAASSAVLFGGKVGEAIGGLQSASYNAAVARNNAAIAKANANLKLAEGTRAEELQRLKTGQLLGAQKAAFAGGNIDISTGSPLDVFADTARMGELDALTLRYNAETEARGLRQTAHAFGAEAGQLMTAGYTNAATSLLGGGGQVADKWMQFAEAGG